MEEVRRLGALEGAEINKAKEVLAFEVTKIVHGQEEATKATQATRALFEGGAQDGSIPTTELGADDFKEGMDILSLLQKTKMVASNSEGRRLVTQGGIRVDGEKVSGIDFQITLDSFKDDSLMLQRGKKTFHRVNLV